ncbi:hypothetical protein QVD17_31651 [Tagetes erecta]|uniref:WRKY domain-containing protein n=1 Tax=Tagetes erecta TaxID=13708 RepID=A0AAD8NPI4_TARER|nr:hypothetical protein QVD17_31651 [Tagetes erecta]
MDNFAPHVYPSTTSPTAVSSHLSLNLMPDNYTNHHHHQLDEHDPINLGLLEKNNSSDEVGLDHVSPTSSDQLCNSEGNNDLNSASGSTGKIHIKKGDKKIKKPKCAFQTRSQVDILDDGYRWRKYGQKAVKNNKFPRSYYRCTYQGCNVKKQVQRLSKDEGVVVTTYEGTHTHPIEKSTDNFEHILTQMQIYSS